MNTYKIGQQIAHKNNTGENAHVINIVTIIEFDFQAIRVRAENGNKYYINRWNIVPMPKLSLPVS